MREQRIDNNRDGNKKRIVVAGFGFGGFSFCRRLRHDLGRRGMEGVDLLVVNDSSRITFTPLLPYLAGSRISPQAISTDIGDLGRKLGFRFIHGRIDQVDLAEKTIVVKGVKMSYDLIVISTGSSDNYHGISITGDNVFQLKTLEDASELARRTLVSNVNPCINGRGSYSLAVIGGGQTGVETTALMSGQVKGHLGPRTLSHERVLLMEASGRILSREPAEASRIALRELERTGVEVRVIAGISGIDGERIVLSDGSSVESETIVWAAGVRANSLIQGIPGRILTGNGRIRVDERLSIAQVRDAYALGDVASIEGPLGKPLPENASVAVQEGRFLAHQVAGIIMNGGTSRSGFRYRDFGHVIPLGHNCLYVGAQGALLTGLPARWLAWAIHFLELFTTRNRLEFLAETFPFIGSMRVKAGHRKRSGRVSGVPAQRFSQ